MGSFMSTTPPEERGFPWHIVAGVAAVLIAVGLAVFFSRQDVDPNAPLPTDPYAEQLELGNLELSTAENFVGGTVTYIDGVVANAGAKTVTGITAEITFRNSLGEVVQRELQPLKVLKMEGPAPDAVPFSAAPLHPGQKVTFRTSWDHISSDWNRGYPELRIVKVETR